MRVLSKGTTMGKLSALRAAARSFIKDSRGNLALIVALSAIPMTLAVGAGVDYTRGLVVHSNMADALDAAALAVGAAKTKPSSCTYGGANSAACAPLQQIAQQYFDANFKADGTSDHVSPVGISIATLTRAVFFAV